MEEQNFILELIEVYRSLPVLWNIESKDYSDRNLKNTAYDTLLIKYKEMYPEATKKDLTSKIVELRTCYRRELKRFSSTERSGAGYNEENESSLFYFDAMNFLHDSEKPAPSRSTMKICDESESEETERPTKKKKKNCYDDIISAAAMRILQSEDEFLKSAEGWANELRLMDKTQAIFAKRFINEILFEGRMGTLNRNSVQINALSSANESPVGLTSTSTTSSSHLKTSIIPPENTAAFSIDSELTSMRISSPLNVQSIYGDELWSSSYTRTPSISLTNVTSAIHTDGLSNATSNNFSSFE